MRPAKSKRGMYEFILTKSVMLIFILGLVGVFYSLYQNMNIKSAHEIADSEAQRVAKEIDEVIGFKGVSNSATVYLKPNLKVGNRAVPYTLEITDNGVVVIEFIEYPYQEIRGIHQFGIDLERKEGEGKAGVDCTYDQIQKGAQLHVSKTGDYKFRTSEQQLYYIVTVEIDASDWCHDRIVYEEWFAEG